MTKQVLLNKFGKRIIALRKEQGITQSELARRSGKDRQNIYRLEKGDLNPTLFQLTEIAAAFNISLAELIDFK
jgi:transcriptional regulator with XRE-family HTH domain